MNDDQERRARRRAVVRELHPDRGGDPEQFDRALRALDDDLPPRSHEIVLTPSHRTRARRRATAIRRTAATRLERLLRTTRLTRRAP